MPTTRTIEEGEELHWTTFQHGHQFDSSNGAPEETFRNTVLQTLCAINQGEGSDERLGLSAHLKGLEVRGAFVLPTNDITDAQTVYSTHDRARLIIFIDNQKNGQTMETSKLMVDAFLLAGVGDDDTISSLSFYNPDGFDRFNILLDKSWDLNYNSVVAGGTGQLMCGTSTYVTEVMPLDETIFYSSAQHGPDAWDNIVSKNLCAVVFSETGILGFLLTFRLYWSTH